jgi:glycosyltransferase involved in cell wall biosynthesis
VRVIQVNKFHYVKGGAERYYVDLSAALVRAGHEVNHLAMAHPRNIPGGTQDRFVPEVDYRAHMGWRERLRQAARTIHNREAARMAGEMARGDGSAPAHRDGPALAHRDGPALAHLHNIYHQLSPSVIDAFVRAGVPVVQTLHDYKLICPAYLLLTEGVVCERCRGGRYWQAARHRCLLDSYAASLVATTEAFWHRARGTYGRVARFLCPSRFLLEKVASFGVPRERLVHLPYFVPLERYRSAPVPVRVAGEPVTGVFVGRLSREKGVATLLEAMATLPPGMVRMEILGEGPLRGELEDKARRVCPDDRIRFLGYRAGDALHDTIRRASFAVVPSEWYENLPYGVLEPFALGRPVVGARIGGIPELVRDGETGRLFPSGDASALAAALAWMAGSQAGLPALGEQARRVVERDHAEAPHLERLLQVYAEVAV